MVGREKKIKRNIMDSLGRRRKKAEEIKRKFNPHPFLPTLTHFWALPFFSSISFLIFPKRTNGS
jgi:hypothetical protein